MVDKFENYPYQWLKICDIYICIWPYNVKKVIYTMLLFIKLTSKYVIFDIGVFQKFSLTLFKK